MLEAALRGGDPVMLGPGWIMANMSLMSALEFGDPIAVFIHVKPDDFFEDAGRRGLRRLHTFILRLFDGEYVKSW